MVEGYSPIPRFVVAISRVQVDRCCSHRGRGQLCNKVFACAGDRPRVELLALRRLPRLRLQCVVLLSAVPAACLRLRFWQRLPRLRPREASPNFLMKLSPRARMAWAPPLPVIIPSSVPGHARVRALLREFFDGPDDEGNGRLVAALDSSFFGDLLGWAFAAVGLYDIAPRLVT